MSGLEGLGYKDSTAVLVGCSTGIGAATANLLVELGARLHTVSRNEPSVSGESFHHVDLTDPDTISAAVTGLGAIGPIDHVFVCAGVPKTRPPREIMQVNYLGVRQLIDSLLPSIVTGGAIGLVSSNTALGWEAHLPLLLELTAIADPLQAARWCDKHPDELGEAFATYVLSKQAMIAWASHWAPTLARDHGIRVNCMLPGPTATPMVDEIAAEMGYAVFDAYPHPVLGRIPTAEEQAWPLLLLNSRLNAVAAGAVLFTDEGVSSGLLTGSIDLSALMPTTAENAL
jgi:NAD(P)-dependent dehydrogenase (short-subunit alcohol dehydrogenase family)